MHLCKLEPASRSRTCFGAFGTKYAVLDGLCVLDVSDACCMYKYSTYAIDHRSHRLRHKHERTSRISRNSPVIPPHHTMRARALFPEGQDTMPRWRWHDKTRK
jgi:hypothetical protein